MAREILDSEEIIDDSSDDRDFYVPVTFSFKLTGTTPLLMHMDDIDEADRVDAYRRAPENKKSGKNGDDRFPPWTWMTYLYRSDGNVAMPQQNVMAALRDAGKKTPAPVGRGTLKSLSQSALQIPALFCKFTNHGEEIAMADILRFQSRSFAEHKQEAKNLGFEIDSRRAKIGTAKHVRCRAMFKVWAVQGEIISTDAIMTSSLKRLFETAGKFAGLGDWRPSSEKSPGSYGMFESKVCQIS